MCQEAPGLTIEKNRLEGTIGGTCLGIVGDQNHDYGYHLCQPAGADDYSGWGAANKAVGDYACAIDIGMDWPAAVAWLHWLIKEIRDDRITGIAEVIGSYDGKNVRYWSDSDGWEDAGVKYNGSGHDHWTHVSVYRSTAKQDHGILKGWTANGNGSGGTVMGDYTPLQPPEAVKLNGVVRGDSVMLVDLWNQEQRGVSPYDGKSPSKRSAQLNTIEAEAKAVRADVAAARADIAKLATGGIDVAALAALLKPFIAEAVRAELGKLTLKATQ